MTWREERRRDKAAEAEQARADAVAAAEIEAIRARTRAESDRADAEQRVQLMRAAARERDAACTERQQRALQRRARRLAAARTWITDRAVDLLIYPLAVVSAVMAIPAMAAFGHDVYGTATGYALPIITELGMWAFAIAVQYTRRHPDRPVWALQLGVWAFATIAAVLNAVHGLMRGVDAGVVMAVASVAGVVAHQLVTAAPRRSRTERDAVRTSRRAARKVAAVRGAAVRAAVAEIDQDGAARLRFAPGRYRLRSRWGFRKELAASAVPGLPVTPVLESAWDNLDRELAELLANPDRHEPPDADPSATGPIGTLDRDVDSVAKPPADRPGEQEQSNQRDGDRPSNRGARRPRKGGSARRSSRSIDELRAELRTRIEADPSSIDPMSAESIRRALRCSPARARQLRDDHKSGD
jgi:hypothetical protein